MKIRTLALLIMFVFIFSHLGSAVDIDSSLRFVTWESDDWGQQQDSALYLPNNSFYENVLALGQDYGAADSWTTSLETLSDTQRFLQHWKSYSASVGKHVPITPFFVMGYPDYDAIEQKNYTKIVTKNITQGHNPVFPETEGLLDMYVQGYQDQIWMPQYHGYLHFNYRTWLSQLRENDPVAHYLFDNNIVGINRSEGGSASAYYYPSLSSEYKNVAKDPNSTDPMLRNFSIPYNETDWLVSNGKQVFYDLFGYHPTSTVAPNYQAGWNTISVWEDQGFNGMTGHVTMPVETCERLNQAGCKTRDYETNMSIIDKRIECDFFWMGKYNPPYWESQYCKGKIESYVTSSQFTAITIHAGGYRSSVNGFGADQMYNNLTALQNWMTQTYPDIIYLTTPEMHQIKTRGYSIQPWYNKTIVRNYLQTDKEISLGGNDSPSSISWNMDRVVVQEVNGDEVEWENQNMNIVFTAESEKEYEIYNGEKRAKQVNSCQMITEDAILTQNITGLDRTCFIIHGKNIIFDCNNNVLSGTGKTRSAQGIHVRNSENVTIKNCNVNGFAVGAKALHSKNIYFKNIDSTENTVGIEFYKAENSHISNSVANSNEKYGIKIYYRKNNRVVDTEANNDGKYGVYIYRSNDNILDGLKSNSNGKHGIYIYRSNNILLDTVTSQSNTQYDLYTRRSSTTVQYNNIGTTKKRR